MVAMWLLVSILTILNIALIVWIWKLKRHQHGTGAVDRAYDTVIAKKKN